MNFKIKGLDDLQKRLKSLSEVSKVPLTEMLTPSFVSSCSRFKDAQELFDSSGFKIDSAEDFKAIPDEKWDEYIRSNTSFPDWKSMLKKAGDEWAVAKLKG